MPKCQTDDIRHKNECARRFINWWRCVDFGTEPVVSKAKKGRAGSISGCGIGRGGGNGNDSFYSRARSHIHTVS